MIRVTANNNRRAPAMSAETAGCIAAAFGIRRPERQAPIGADLAPESIEKLVVSVHDAMLGNAMEGVDKVSANDLWDEVCAPVAHINAALKVMVERGYARRGSGSWGNSYTLCRTSAAVAIHVDPVPAPEPKKAKSKAGKKASNVKLTAVQAG